MVAVPVNCWLSTCSIPVSQYYSYCHSGGSASQLLPVYMQHPGESVLHILSLWWWLVSAVMELRTWTKLPYVGHGYYWVITTVTHRVWIQFPVRDIYLDMWPATQVNSAWPSLVDRHDEYQPKGGDALQLWFVCGWQVKLWSPCYTRAISERFRDKGLIIKCCI